MTLLDLLDAPVPRDSHVVEPGEVRRLQGQNARIIERLQRGPATNRELAGISLKYTSRVSDCRHAGYVITAHRHPCGLTIYTLGSSTELPQWGAR